MDSFEIINSKLEERKKRQQYITPENLPISESNGKDSIGDIFGATEVVERTPYTDIHGKKGEAISKRTGGGAIDVEGVLPQRDSASISQSSEYIPEIPEDVAIKIKNYNESSYQKAIDDIKKNHASRNDEGDFKWSDLLTMAIPVVVGGAMGHSNVGAGVGADYGYRRMNEDRAEKKSLKDALDKIALKRAELASENEMKTQSDLNKVGTYIVDGKLVPLTHRQAIQMKAQPADKGFYAQNARGSVLNTVTGEQRSNQGALTPQEELAKKKFEQQKQKDRYSMIKGNMIQPAELSNHRNNINSLRVSASELRAGNKLAIEGIKRALYRTVSGEGKVLSDADAKAMGLDQGTIENIRNYITKIESGNASTQELKYVESMLPRVYEATRRSYNNMLKRNAQTLKDNEIDLPNYDSLYINDTISDIKFGSDNEIRQKNGPTFYKAD